MKQIIKDIYKLNRCLLGEGYDNALEYIKHLIDLDVIEIKSGTRFDTWTVPDEWIVRDAWVKHKGKKIIDYKKEPLSLAVGSCPFKGQVDLEELKNHITVSDDMPDATPYNYIFYDKQWGFCMPKNQLKEKIETKCEGGTCAPELKDIDPSVGKVQIEGQNYNPKYKDKLKKGKYEVFIDTEYKPGKMKIGVHTIKGKTDREILLFAHLDHPFQANDNLSGVACLINMAKRIKKADFEHTIKLVFCPETIGSIGYAFTQDISKVDFMIALDAIGNDNSLLFQKSFNPEDKINNITHLAIQNLGESYRKGVFRALIGSDEYVFNDPDIGIQGIMLSRFPYKEYHTNADTPDIIVEDKIKRIQELIMKIIDIWEKDYVPIKAFKGPLMRSRYDAQTPFKNLNLSYDHLFYSIDGKISLAELCSDFALNFDYTYELFNKIKKDGYIRVNDSKGQIK